MQIRRRALLAAGSVAILVGCGSSARREPSSTSQAGSSASGGGSANAGGSASASAGGGASASGSLAGSTAGGSLATGGASAGSGAGGSEASAGAAGEGGEGNEGPSNTDFSWALWPMPNTPSSGLPHPLSYDTSLEGIVTDNVTGLIWQKEPAPFLVAQKDAANVCKALNLGGQTDWRLPSRLELVSLMAIERESGVDSTAFPASPLSSGYWSSSAYARSNQGSTWVVTGIRVFESSPGSDETYRVRCVRSLPRPAPQTLHYLVVTDVVQDTWTGLWWERTEPPLWRTFNEAKTYCDNLTLGGYSDWYFPSIKEMLTILDEHQSWPALDTEAFPGPEEVTSGWTWSSSLFPSMGDEPAWALATRFGDGFTWDERLPGGWLSRCARQDP